MGDAAVNQRVTDWRRTDDGRIIASPDADVAAPR
jgi:hypothetical protein